MGMYVESPTYLESARQRGVSFILEPDKRVVVTGFAAISPFGNTKQTWEGIQAGESAVTILDTGNQHTKLAAPLPSNYNPFELMPAADTKRISRLAAMSVVASREAGKLAGLLDENGRLRTNLVHPNKVGSWIASGITETPLLIDVNNQIYKKNDQGVIDMIANTRKLELGLALSVFPEEMNGDTARLLGLSGWGGNSAEACATGASNIVEGARLIQEGRLKAAIVGGFEDALYKHPAIVHMLFATGVQTLSKRNHDPSSASRPFDKERDGFIPGSGGGVLVLESERFARARGATIYAEILGFSKSMDGTSKTALNPTRVADTIAESLWQSDSGRLYKPDTIFAHATSTPLGDKSEAKALRLVFGDDLGGISIAALKSYFGHLLGGAGSINVVAAVKAISEGYIPQIINLDNPDPEIMADGPMDLVMKEPRIRNINSILALAYGFGGYNASLLLGKYIP